MLCVNRVKNHNKSKPEALKNIRYAHAGKSGLYFLTAFLRNHSALLQMGIKNRSRMRAVLIVYKCSDKLGANLAEL